VSDIQTPTTSPVSTSAVSGLPRQILRAEGLTLLAAALVVYFDALDQPYWLVPLLLFVPDLFMVGYAQSTRVGAALYNAAHSYPAPAALGLTALLTGQPLGEAIALIWLAHIGMDRALGYGLKYDTDFKDTHLGWIGA
jgi:hypothetical protein